MFYLHKKNKKRQGFQIKLDNGYTVSVQFGGFSWSSNGVRFDKGGLKAVQENKSFSAETAIIKPNGKFLKWGRDHVQAYQKASDFINTLNYANSLEPNNYGRVAS